MANTSEPIAPQRATTVLRGRRYQLRAPIDFQVVSWLDFQRKYEEFVTATDPAIVNGRLLILMGSIFFFGEERPVWRNLLWRALGRPSIESSGPDVRTVLSWTFGERLHALQDFTRALSVTGAMTTSRPTPTPETESPLLP